MIFNTKLTCKTMIVDRELYKALRSVYHLSDLLSRNEMAVALGGPFFALTIESGGAFDEPIHFLSR